MITDRASLKSYTAADHVSRGDGNRLRAFLLDPVSRFTVLMRVNEYLLNTGKPLLVRAPFLLWYRRLSVRLGFSVNLNIFGPGVAIVHYGLLVIDPTARLGKNARIHAGVNIGGAAVFVDPAEMHLYSPKIGDNVYIGPGAKLYGPIVIGNNCVIGANAVVTKSFPQDNVTIAGVPAKVISQVGSADRILHGAAEDRS